MGEASDYEQMMEDIGRAAEAEAEAAAAALEQQYQDKEAAYVNGPQKYWQLGCPFNLKDIVVVVRRCRPRHCGQCICGKL